MKMKLFGLLIGVLLLLSPGLMGQGIPYSSTTPAPAGASPSSCGSIWKIKAFEADAVWTVPAGVDVVWVTGVGGGGGGASAWGGGRVLAGGGGGAGSSSHRAPVDVNGMTSVSIVIGLGGAADHPGGHTKFGEFVVGRGGSPGYKKDGGTNGAGFLGDSIEGGMFSSGGGGGNAYDAYKPGPAPGNSSRTAGGKRTSTGGGGGGASTYGWGELVHSTMETRKMVREPEQAAAVPRITGPPVQGTLRDVVAMVS